MIGKDDIRQLEQDNEYWKNELKKSNDINSELMVVQLQLEQKNERLRELLEECYRYISRVSDDRGAFSYDKELTEKLEKALEEK